MTQYSISRRAIVIVVAIFIVLIALCVYLYFKQDKQGVWYVCNEPVKGKTRLYAQTDKDPVTYQYICY